MESVVAGLADVSSCRGKEVCIDLQQVEFFEPFGITFLPLACRYLISQNLMPRVRLPLTGSPQAYYLKRMGVPPILREWAKLDNLLWPKGRGWERSSGVLLELTSFRQAAEIEQIVVRRVYKILKTQLNYGPAELSAFSNIVAEQSGN